MAQLVRFRVRQGLKDYLRAAVEQEKGVDPRFRRSLSDIVRWALEECVSSRLSPDAARELIRTERWALDGAFTPPISLYRYRDTRWTTVNVQLDPALLDALRGEAARLGVKRDELMRGALFDTLFPRFDRPPNQWPSEAEVGYVHAFDRDFRPIDPRHPLNRGRENEALERLRRGAADPKHPEPYASIEIKFQDFLRKLSDDYERFIGAQYDDDATDQTR